MKNPIKKILDRIRGEQNLEKLIKRGLVVGKDFNCMGGVIIDPSHCWHIKIGNNVKIQNGVSVYNGVTVADDVFIGPNAAFTNDYYPRACNPDWEVSETKVEKGASIGANATVVCRHTLGRYCMVGAGSVVTEDVAPYTLVVGNPAHPIGKVCRCGARVGDDLVCPKCGFDLKTDGITE